MSSVNIVGVCVIYVGVVAVVGSCDDDAGIVITCRL